MCSERLLNVSNKTFGCFTQNFERLYSSTPNMNAAPALATPIDPKFLIVLDSGFKIYF